MTTVLYSKRKQEAALREVAACLMEDPPGSYYAYDVWKSVRRLGPYRAIHVYRALNELMRRGWVADGWEDVPAGEDRPPKRFYVATIGGRERIAEMLELIR